MKRLIVLFLSVALSAVCSAQTQQGYVKTRGRLGVNGALIAGKRLPGATVGIKGRNAVNSGKNGTFSFTLPANTFYLTSVQKVGYQLCDREQLNRVYQVSGNPLIIVMDTPDNVLDDKLEAQSKIRQTLQEQLRKKEEELEALRRQQKITQEQFRKQRQELYAAQEKDEKLIAEMAERYSTLDFDQMDEFQRRVATFIQNGELARADSLLNTKGSMEERSKELDRMNEAIKADAEDLAKRQEAHDKSVALKDKTLKDFAADCHSRYEMCLLEHKNDSAAYWLELRAAKDTMNVEWQLWAGNTIEVFLANYKQAFAYYQRALNVALMQYGERHPYVPVCYNKIGILCDSLGNYSLALECFQKSLNGIIELYGENNADAGTRYHNIASIYESLGDYASAQKYEQKALEIDLNVSGENDPDIASCYNGMGIIYCKMGNYPLAMENFQKALKIWEELYGPKNRHAATCYINIGSIYEKQYDYALAMEYHQKALDIRREVYGDNHPDVAATYNSIGVAYCSYYLFDSASSGCDTRAMENFQKALQIRLNVYGENSYYVAESYHNIASVFGLQGDFESQLNYNQKALKILLLVFGDNHPTVATSYNNIAVNFSLQGDVASALEYYRKALDIKLKIYGENHPDVALVYENMGDEYEKQEDLTSALECYQKALKINLNVWGENHPDVSKGYNNVGHVSSALGDYATALECYKRNLTILAMDNGVFYQHHFENKTGLFFDMKEVGAEEKQRIIKAYHQWKKENKENKQNDSL